MKKIYLIVILSFISLVATSQNFTGTVYGKNKSTTIEEVHVFTKNSKGGTLTNKNGKFSLKINKNTDTIFFSHIGYKTYAFSYTRKRNNIIVLEEKLEKLDEITIQNRKKLQNRIRYTKLASMKQGVYDFDGYTADNKIYIFGGNTTSQVDALGQAVFDYPTLSFKEQLYKAKGYFSSEHFSGLVQIYDIKYNRWFIDDIEIKKRANHTVHPYNDNIYIIGGKRLSMNKRFEYLENEIEIYNPIKKTIIKDKTNPHQAVNFSSFVYKNNLIVIGGSYKLKKSGDKKYLNTVHMYDFKTGLWYDLAKMPVAQETKGALIDDKIYLIGGYNENPLVSIDSYDLINGKWKKEGNLFNGIVKPAINSKEAIIYFYEDRNFYTYDTNSKELKEYLIDLSLKGSKMYLIDNKLYLIGGFIEEEFSINPSSSVYSIDLEEFNKTRVFKSKIL